MPKIDRNNPDDARKITALFLKSPSQRITLLKFLAESINYANHLAPENWNLNFDKNGKFIRFNVGQEYCLKIFKEKVLILCIKKTLRSKIKDKNLEIEFQGYAEKYIKSKNIDAVPDILAKVPDSVGCLIKHHNIEQYLPLLRDAHRAFLKYGILNTRLMPIMRRAHSKGYLEYLSELGLFADLEHNAQQSRTSDEKTRTKTAREREKKDKRDHQISQTWEILIAHAQQNTYVTYGDIGKQVGVNARQVGKFLLKPILLFCGENNFPVLTAVVTRKGSKKSGFKDINDTLKNNGMPTITEKQSYVLDSVFSFDWKVLKNPFSSSGKLRIDINYEHHQGTPVESEAKENKVLLEGNKRDTRITRYERDPKARRKCIDYWKPLCAVCGFDFEKQYGELGKGYIHVHHLTPISNIGKQYKIDPINDLRPVCPNCHSMLHKCNPPFAIEELKEIRRSVCTPHLKNK